MPFTDPFIANPYPYAFSCTLPSTTNPGAPYEIIGAFVSGIYTISWSGGGTLNVDFYNGTTFIGTATGTSSITYNLAQSATKAVLWNTIAGVSVVISLTALAIAPVSGVLTTYTTSQTITAVGDGYAILVGGGGGGGGALNYPGGGGGSGGIIAGRVALTGSLVLTIGTAGNGGATGNNPGTAGLATTFGGLTANGGNGGLAGNGAFGAGGAGGTPNGVAGGTTTLSNSGAPGSATVNSNTFYSFMTQGTTGSGAGGCVSTNAGIGGGLGIGTGGNGGLGVQNGSPATGFGGGGGGAGSTGGAQAGGDGSSGVMYLIVVP